MSSYLSARDGEFLLALLALSGLVVFEPGVALTNGRTRRDQSGAFYFYVTASILQAQHSSHLYLQSFVDLLEVLHLKFRPFDKKTKQVKLQWYMFKSDKRF